MKRIVLSLIVSAPLLSVGQWVHTFDTAECRKIELINEKTIVANSLKSIIKSTDGGKSWYNTISPDFYVGEFDFPTENVGYAGGWLKGKGILKTTDAGETWSLIPGFSKICRSLSFVDENIGFVGTSEGLYKTVDGGNNFTISFSDLTSGFLEGVQDISFPVDSVGYISFRKFNDITELSIFQILKTENQGESWSVIYSDTSWVSPFVITQGQIQFIDENVGFYVNIYSNGIFMTTEDGGITWEEKVLPSEGWLFSQDVFFLSKDIGWVVIDERLYKTQDGGDSWEEVYVDENPKLRDCIFISEDIGVLAGEKGVYVNILMNIGGPEVAKVETEINLYPNPAKELIVITSEGGFINQVDFYDMSGMLIRSVHDNFNSVNISDLPKGVYIIRVHNHKGIKNMRLVKD